MLGAAIERVRRAARGLKNTIAPGALILLYHRIAEAANDPWSLCVTPQHFREHLEVLRTEYLPISLKRLNRALGARQGFSGSVVITFDDGYADNLYRAKPLLEKYDIPATVFVISGSVGRAREFWWDELERLTLQPRTLPVTLHLAIGDNGFNWTSWEASKRRDEGCLVRQVIPNDERQSLYRALWERLCLVSETERHELLDQLLVWSQADSGSRSTHRPIAAEEIRELAEGQLIEIGSHTVSHPFLSKLSAVDQMKELGESRRCLEDIAGSGVTSFSYPHGDYARKTAALVAEVGYTCACSTAPEGVLGYTDPLRLPRFVIQDWNGEEFARRVSEWFRG